MAPPPILVHSIHRYFSIICSEIVFVMDHVQIWLRQRSQRLITVPTQHHAGRHKPWTGIALGASTNLHQYSHCGEWPPDLPGHPQRAHIGGSIASRRQGHGGNRYGTATNLSWSFNKTRKHTVPVLVSFPVSNHDKNASFDMCFPVWVYL